MILLDWTMKDDYSRLKQRAGEWRHWTYEPAYSKAENHEEEEWKDE